VAGLPGAEPIRVMRLAAHHDQRQHPNKRSTQVLSREGAGEQSPRRPPDATRTSGSIHYLKNSYKPLKNKG